MVFIKLIEYILLRYNNLKRKYLKKKYCYLFKKIGQNIHLGFDLICLGEENIIIGDNFTCGERLNLRTFNKWRGDKYTPHIIIGNNVNIESDCHISAINSVVIEDNVLIASFVFISDMAHGNDNYADLDMAPLDRPLFSKGPIHICKNVWIGEKATILPGVTIGESSIIGANSVVTKDIPPFSIAVGAPAHVIKTIKQ